MPTVDENFIKRIQPHSEEAEKSVLGSMLMDRDAIVEAEDILVKEDFYQRQYGILFEAMVELYQEGKPVDLITLQDKLKEKDVPEALSSLDFFRELVDIVPTSTNVRQYAQIVHDKATLRSLIKVTEDIGNACYLGKEETPAILEKTEKEIFGLLQNRNRMSDFVPIQDIVLNSLNAIEDAAKTRGRVTGIATGFTELDYKLTGLHPAELILVAARPAMGKTAFVLNIAQYAAFKDNHAIAMFSLEMSKEQLVTRLMASESMVDSQQIRTGDLRDSDWEKLLEGAALIGNSRLIIDDTASSLAEIRSKCRKYKQTYDIEMVVIDYLQLMSGSNTRRNESRQQEISEISRALKVLARELNIPIIALSQLSRAVEARQDHRPMLSDLRESGAIEQDADVVMFLYRDEYYNPDTEKKNIAEVIVAKQRNGATGSIELVWLGQYTKFANKERIQ
ncbi:MAG TPA: replicative DNA helicase [Candidatus Anaerobutyricum stercoris]|uniref:Replicative DNA helicase n=1 Tax=Candidatus Anaerobutyricum stercoris TaxID=2838457 RepID=A0A9D2EK23_9FIRM|nr:replicative DNA helicase [Eubacterium sp. An3]OUO29086.1 replicative DNA helicase [Eubacterium sp. An3]CVI66519.1 Replicative DNA helicase [Eubacteriaceae bacterium CHKCI004]HIZ39064.1 replicative DNA helicase [Candidatus Anaerobutyricum stercoris]